MLFTSLLDSCTGSAAVAATAVVYHLFRFTIIMQQQALNVQAQQNKGTLVPGQTISVNKYTVQVERYLSQGVPNPIAVSSTVNTFLQRRILPCLPCQDPHARL